jgi:hypothetical protein
VYAITRSRAYDSWYCVEVRLLALVLHATKLLFVRPGTNWTSWFTFLVAGVMQASLLVMCIAWKFRQHRLGIDDFGNSVGPTPVEESRRVVMEVSNDDVVEDERTPLVRK